MSINHLLGYFSGPMNLDFRGPLDQKVRATRLAPQLPDLETQISESHLNDSKVIDVKVLLRHLDQMDFEQFSNAYQHLILQQNRKLIDSKTLF